MKTMMEKFLSNKWNLYGLQIASSILMIMVLYQYLSIMGMFAMALCVYIIAICQRILGVGTGMMHYAVNKKELVNLLAKVREERGEVLVEKWDKEAKEKDNDNKKNK